MLYCFKHDNIAIDKHKLRMNNKISLRKRNFLKRNLNINKKWKEITYF